jgi:hypothetical protein
MLDDLTQIESQACPAARSLAANTTLSTPRRGYTKKRSRSRRGDARKAWLIGLTLFGVVCLLGCGGLLVAVFLPPIRAAIEHANYEAAGAEVEGGVTYESPSGSYSVWMIGTPSVETSKGNLSVWEIALVESREGTWCAVAHTRRPASMTDVDEYLNLGITSMKQIVDDVRVISDHAISYEGHPGREIEFTGRVFGDPVWGTGRMIITDRIAYKLFWHSPPGQEAESNAQRFIDSFTLTEKRH